MNKAEYVEQFKVADNILKSDVFSNLLVKIHPDGRQEKAVVADWYNQIASITSHENVPTVNNESKYFNDDGTEINPDLVPKPDLCISCKKDGSPGKEEILCNLTRTDQRGEGEFHCEAYEAKG